MRISTKIARSTTLPIISVKNQLFAKNNNLIENLFCTLNATLRDVSEKLSCSRSRHFPTKWQRIEDLVFHFFSNSPFCLLVVGEIFSLPLHDGKSSRSPVIQLRFGWKLTGWSVVVYSTRIRALFMGPALVSLTFSTFWNCTYYLWPGFRPK